MASGYGLTTGASAAEEPDSVFDGYTQQTTGALDNQILPGGLLENIWNGLDRLGGGSGRHPFRQNFSKNPAKSMACGVFVFRSANRGRQRRALPIRGRTVTLSLVATVVCGLQCSAVPETARDAKPVLLGTFTPFNAQRMLMRPSVVLDLKRGAVREAAGRYRAANPRVFGSVVHGTDRDGSDLDLLVDALPGATLFDLGGLQDELESLLGIHVDLLTPADLPPKFRAKVLAEARPV